MDSYWARLIIRGRIEQRQLPSGRAADISEGMGDGHRCDACGETMRANQRAVIATVSSPWRSLRFHAECFEIWNLERVSAPRQKSAEEQLPHQHSPGTADKPSRLSSV